MVAREDDNKAAILDEALTRFVNVYVQGENPDIDEFVRQYPQHQTLIRRRIESLREIDSLFDSLVRADEIDFAATATGYDLAGRRIGQFEIREMIGRGGMGIVYLARDTKLKRSVAIKSMPAELQANSRARTRFRREAELLASLNHPNIAAIYDIVEQEESAGYLVLEYVPGETLAQRIAREPLRLEDAFSIGLQIAEAVAAAHDKGVVHRDLKPGNIKITPEGKVKVLDFGLAKASPPKGQSVETAVTRPGRIMGTPAYMSPEQACGKDTDYRTDIWSFGCIMYEMLTGNIPFEGETATDTVARILEREPDWQALPQDTPTNIRTLLRRCLEKDPRRRLRDIGDAAIEIRESLAPPATATAAALATPAPSPRRWAMVIGLIVIMLALLLAVVGPVLREKLLGGASSGQIESLAVLPLQNLTGDPNQEHYAEGLTVELIAELGKIGAMQVKSRTSSMLYKELKVDAIVEGSLLRVGEQVRLTAKLIHAPTDTHLWVDSYERDPPDIPTLLSEMARTIAEQIEIRLTPDEEALLAEKRPVNPETHNTYLLGMFYLNKQTPEGTQKGLEYLQQAIDKDPSDARAYGAMAMGYAVSAHGPGASPDAGRLAREAANKALKLDNNLAEAHAALAINKLYGTRDWKTVEQSFQDALKLNSTLAVARAHYSWYLQLFGRTDEALAQMRQAQTIDPLSPLWPAWLGTQYLWAGQPDKAIEKAQESLDLAPDFPVALSVLGSVYAEKGMYEEAIKEYRKAADLSPIWRSSLASTYAQAGRLDEARSLLAELEADPTPWDVFFIAEIYAVLGEKDQVFRWLETAFEPPQHSYVPWIKHFPGFKPLRDDPRFADLLRRMNLPE
ncbi:MAG: protein kinase domain-containing protein [Planctomycetota bacterium]|jgi:serine/threonine-protein kinase